MQHTFKIWALCFAGLATPSLGYTAGFYLKEQSIVSQGLAFAGASARNDVASSIYFNPAGTAGVGDIVELGTHILVPNQTVSDTGTDQNINAAVGAPTNSADQEPLDVKVIPNLYITKDFLDGTFGIGVSAPFGSTNTYDNDFVGSIDSYKTSLKTINLSATYAREFVEGFRLGGGVIYQTAKISQYKQTAAGVASIKGDSATIGWSLGAQKDFGDTFTLGVSYLSGFSQDIEGTQTIQAFGSGAAKGTLDMPSIMSVGGRWGVRDNTDVLFELSAYDWSVLDQVNIDGALADTTLRFNYKDTTSIALGVEHRYSDDWVARAGMQYDQTPTNNTDRSLMTPDGDRIWLSLGLSKKLSDVMHLDAAYTHIHVEDGIVNKTVPLAPGVSNTVKAKAETAFHIVSIGLRIQF